MFFLAVCGVLISMGVYEVFHRAGAFEQIASEDFEEVEFPERYAGIAEHLGHYHTIPKLLHRLKCLLRKDKTVPQQAFVVKYLDQRKTKYDDLAAHAGWFFDSPTPVRTARRHMYTRTTLPACKYLCLKWDYTSQFAEAWVNPWKIWNAVEQECYNRRIRFNALFQVYDIDQTQTAVTYMVPIDYTPIPVLPQTIVEEHQRRMSYVNRTPDEKKTW
eukprot:GFYU01026905.1.p2 GENE.GFYU01026905.1~~GFYU01026905.1.p2  ORF type:complete len:216 (+),score=24.67 GFYU01026905.1:152-799(+)